MAFSPFTKLRVISDEDISPKNINAIQDNIATALGQVLGKDALDVTVVQNVKLAAGLNKVSHMLGRTLSGWMVTRTHGSFPMLYDLQDTNPSPSLLLYLVSATAVTVDLMVF